ncbi:MAG: hypothetical protein ACFFAN_04185 [Promethearchaeota archaeon]
MAVQIVQSFIGALTIFPVYYLACKYFSHKVAIWACLIFAFYPDFLYSVYVLHSLTIITFLIPTTIYFKFIFEEEPTYKKAIFFDILYDFSLLFKPILTLMFCFLLF